MDSLPPFVILLAPFVDGPALVQIITDPPCAVDAADADRSAVARLRLGPQHGGPQWWVRLQSLSARSSSASPHRPATSRPTAIRPTNAYNPLAIR